VGSGAGTDVAWAGTANVVVETERLAGLDKHEAVAVAAGHGRMLAVPGDASGAACHVVGVTPEADDADGPKPALVAPVLRVAAIVAWGAKAA
jgi:hypothetical protein